MKKLKRGASLFLALMLCFLCMGGGAEAAVTWPATSNIKTYVISTKNDTTVYETSTSKAKYGTIYAADLITIKGYSGTRLKVTYPVTGTTKTKSGWIEKSAVTASGINSVSSVFNATGTMTAYRRSSGSATVGSISKNDKVYVIATSGSRKQVIYPLDAGGYKMGWIESNNSNLRYPIRGDIIRCSNKKTNGEYCDYAASTGTPVYAPADGTVEFRQSYAVNYSKLASYGNHILFKTKDGKTTVLCAHFQSFNNVARKYTSSLSYPCGVANYKCSTITLATRTVKQGDLLGYTGMTGNASGPHIHIEVKVNGTPIAPISAFATW